MVMKTNRLAIHLPGLGIDGTTQSSGVGTNNKRAALLDRRLTVTGKITAPKSELVIEGSVEGEVTAYRVFISETGRIIGNLKAVLVEVAGQVRGRIEAKAVALKASARVDATIYHYTLTIERGAVVDGLRPWRPEGYWSLFGRQGSNQGQTQLPPGFKQLHQIQKILKY